AEPAPTDGEHRILVEQLVLRGRLGDAERRLEGRRSLEADVERAFLSLLQGRTGEAVAAYEAALVEHRKKAGRAAIFPDRAGLFFVVALLAEGSARSLARAAALADAAKRSHLLEKAYLVLSEVVGVLEGRKDLRELLFVTSEVDLASRDLVEILLQAAAAAWVKAKL